MLEKYLERVLKKGRWTKFKYYVKLMVMFSFAKTGCTVPKVVLGGNQMSRLEVTVNPNKIDLEVDDNEGKPSECELLQDRLVNGKLSVRVPVEDASEIEMVVKMEKRDEAGRKNVSIETRVIEIKTEPDGLEMKRAVVFDGTVNGQITIKIL